MNYSIQKASFLGYGVRYENDELYICAAINYLNKAGINFYNLESNEKILSIPFPEDLFIGNTAICKISGLNLKEYGYLLHGDDNEFIDPYSRRISLDGKYCMLEADTLPKDFEDDNPINIPYEDSVIYLTSVRGQTMLDKGVKVAKGTFKALESKISYFKSLSVTALELMPLYETVALKPDFRKPESDSKKNYWGFGEGYHFAIRNDLAGSDAPAYEFRHLVMKMHENGIEVIPIFSFSNLVTKEYIINVLKYWVINFHIDGFRLIGEHIPIGDIVSEPLFSRTKILCENFDFEGYKPVYLSKYKNLSKSNDRFLECARKLLKSDEDQVSSFSYYARENGKYYSALRYITDFSGFTLNDLVSYNAKHNEENGEEGKDGTDYNYSWNCGEEGPSRKKKIIELRKKQLRNAFLLTYLCQGTPVLRAGDEVLNSQNGNNNPYCQDNEVGWVSYRTDKSAKEFFDFTKNLLAFRMRHSILHQPKSLMMFDYMSCKSPDVSYHGIEAYKADFLPSSREFGVFYSGEYAKQYIGRAEDSIYIAYNLNWEERSFALPMHKADKGWRLLYSSDGSTDESFDEKNGIELQGNSYNASPRSISVLILQDLTEKSVRSKL